MRLQRFVVRNDESRATVVSPSSRHDAERTPIRRPDRENVKRGSRESGVSPPLQSPQLRITWAKSFLMGFLLFSCTTGDRSRTRCCVNRTARIGRRRRRCLSTRVYARARARAAFFNDRERSPLTRITIADRLLARRCEPRGFSRNEDVNPRDCLPARELRRLPPRAIANVFNALFIRRR